MILSGTDVRGRPGYTRFRGSSFMVGASSSGKAAGTCGYVPAALCGGATVRRYASLRWRRGQAGRARALLGQPTILRAWWPSPASYCGVVCVHAALEPLYEALE